MNRSHRPYTIKLAGRETESRQITVIATDATPDRVGDIVEPTGADLSQYRRNPVVLFNHDTEKPIAKCSSITQNAINITATIQFPAAGISTLSDDILSLVQAGILSAVSIGFRPIKWKYLSETGFGMRFTEWELLEISVVSVPANPSALVSERAIQRSRSAAAMATSSPAFGMATGVLAHAKSNPVRARDADLHRLMAQRENADFRRRIIHAQQIRRSTW